MSNEEVVPELQNAQDMMRCPNCREFQSDKVRDYGLYVAGEMAEDECEHCCHVLRTVVVEPYKTYRVTARPPKNNFD